MPKPQPGAGPVMGIRCPKCRRGSLVRTTKGGGPRLGWVECGNASCGYKDTLHKVLGEHRKWILAVNDPGKRAEALSRKKARRG